MFLVLIFLFFSLFILFLFFLYYFIKLKKKKGEENEKERMQQEILSNFQHQIWEKFGVELEKIHEKSTKDEIVRIVNLDAIKTSKECVNYDKQIRGELHCSWNYEGGSRRLKGLWAEKRKLALQICPELAERLPHFSEFEPLKSYNAEHLLQKKAKREAAQK